MKSFKKFMSIGLLVVVTSIVSLSWCAAQISGLTPAASEGNIIANPSFSKADGKQPKRWLFDDANSGKGQISVAKGSDGNMRLSLRPSKLNTTDILALNVAQAFDPTPLKNTTLEISGKLGATDGAFAVLQLSVIDSSGAMLASATLLQEPTTGGMISHKTTLQIPDDDRAVMLIVNCQVRGTSGEALFDDIDIRRQPDTDQVAVEVTPASTNVGNFTATIAIEARRDLRPVNRELFGVNVAWPRGGNGVLKFQTSDYDPGVLKMSKDLAPSLLRFPGGTYSDFYTWRDGIGSLDKRPKTAPTPSEGQKYTHELGTDEALDFAREIDSRLLITVNAGTGSAKQAAEWVEYVNKEKADQNAKNRVDYWEVGNELYLKGEIIMTPEKYVKKFLNFAEAMRAVDPKIKLGALGSENYFEDKEFEYTHRKWTNKILKAAGHEIDFLSIHNAYSPSLINSGSDKDLQTVYQAMLASPVLIEKNLQETAARIRKHAPLHADRIKIAVTEWGPFFAFDYKNRYMDHVKTLGSALFTGSVMNAFLRVPEVTIANFFELSSFTPPSLIAPRDGKSIQDWLDAEDGLFRENALYYALQLYTKHFGDVLVATETQSDTFDSTQVGWVNAVRDVPYLDVVASRSNDRKTLYLMVINKHFDSAIDTAIDIKQFKPGANAKVLTLNGNGIDAHTGTRPIKVPGINWPKPAQANKNSRILKGGLDEIELRETEVSIGPGFRYTFPAHSITALQIPVAE